MTGLDYSRTTGGRTCPSEWVDATGTAPRSTDTFGIAHVDGADLSRLLRRIKPKGAKDQEVTNG